MKEREYKIGVGIITCNRNEMLYNLIMSLDTSKIDHSIVVNDGESQHHSSFIVHHDGEDIELFDLIDRMSYNYIDTDMEGVGKAKNRALKELLDAGCDYIFIIEDDMVILNNDIFEEYIKISKATGIEHLMFGYHGPANKRNISNGTPSPKYKIDYGDVSIDIIHHCVGAFCMYTARSLKEVGIFDEEYMNAFEHVDHSYKLAKSGYSTPYWNWADISNSTNYIREQACSEVNSTITPRIDWKSNIQRAWNTFTKKHGYTPMSVPDISLEDLKKTLKLIHSKKA